VASLKVLILGSTGLVGGHFRKLCEDSDRVGEVRLLLRKMPSSVPSKTAFKITDFSFLF